MRPTIVATLAAAALVAAPLAASAAPPGPEDPPSTWNTREHEAHRSAPSPGPAGRAPVSSPCAAALAQAWEDLGHFSDGMETWLLKTDACRTSPTSASRWSGSAV